MNVPPSNTIREIRVSAGAVVSSPHEVPPSVLRNMWPTASPAHTTLVSVGSTATAAVAENPGPAVSVVQVAPPFVVLRTCPKLYAT